MNVKEYLFLNRNNYSCIPGCGKCCADKAGPAKCGFKTNGYCSVHPTLVGEKEANKLRNPECDFDPVSVSVILKFACPVIAQAILTLTGESPKEDNAFSFTGASHFNSRHLEKLLNQQIRSN